MLHRTFIVAICFLLSVYHVERRQGVAFGFSDTKIETWAKEKWVRETSLYPSWHANSTLATPDGTIRRWWSMERRSFRPSSPQR